MRRSTAAVALTVVAVGAAAGGAAAYARSAHDTTVTLSVDGSSQKVGTHARNVADLLSSRHLAVGSHDVLAPEASTQLRDGEVVTLRHGRPLELTVDGVAKTVWVTQTTVAQALDKLGLLVDGSVISASRSREIPLSGLAVDVRTPRLVTVVADGHTVRTVTTALTVGDLLRQVHVTLRPTDAVSVPVTAQTRTGMTVSVTRHSAHLLQVASPIAYGNVQRVDATSYVGTSRIGQAGRAGVLVSTYQVAFTNGKESGRSLVSTVVAQPALGQVVLVGSRPVPAPAPAPVAPAPVAPAPVTNPPSGSWGDAGDAVWAGVPSWIRLDAKCVRNHESASAGLYVAQNPSSTASGAYQMLDSTYQSFTRLVGLPNHGRAMYAPPADQDRIFIFAAEHGMLGNWAGTNCAGT